MKISNLALIAFISTIICGIAVYGILQIHNQVAIQHRGHQHQIPQPGSDRSAAISKSTALLLLAAGFMGVLSVRRKKKNKRDPAQKRGSQTTSEDRNEAFIKLNKQYLDLQYRITLHKSSGDTPPAGLQKEISDLERKVRLISRALE